VTHPQHLPLAGQTGQAPDERQFGALMLGESADGQGRAAEDKWPGAAETW